MDRKLLVTLLRKNIQELDMITEGFMEMNEYPKAIVLLAKRKTEDIQEYLQQLSAMKAEPCPTLSAPSMVEIPQPAAPIEVATAPLIEPLVEVATPEIPEEEPVAYDPHHEVAAEPLTTITSAPLAPDTEPIASVQAVITENSAKTVLGEKPATTFLSRNETLSKTDNSLGTTLANKKITDIKQAISIGDRFRFQRELFKSNGEEMNKTLHYINQLATLEEAVSFLNSKYNWDLENETAADFIQIVKRRFL